MTTHYLFRSWPNDPEPLARAWGLATKLSEEGNKSITILVPRKDLAENYGLSSLLPSDVIKRLKRNISCALGQSVVSLQSDQSIRAREEHGVILAISCTPVTLQRLADAWRVEAIVAVTFEPADLDDWASKVNAIAY